MPSPPAPQTPVLSAAGRLAAGVVALVATGGLLLQLLVTLGMLTAQGFSVPAALWRYLAFFTVLTNLLVAVTLAAATRAGSGRGPSPSTITGVVLAIGVVGVVYDQLLSGRVPEMGAMWWTADRTLHYVVPSLTVLWWLVFVPKHTLTVADPPRWLAYPLGYLVYALVRGAFDGWYPYFFVDVGQLGYPQALLNAAGLAIAMLIVGYGLVAVVRLTPGGARPMSQ